MLRMVGNCRIEGSQISSGIAFCSNGNKKAPTGAVGASDKLVWLTSWRHDCQTHETVGYVGDGVGAADRDRTLAAVENVANLDGVQR